MDQTSETTPDKIRVGIFFGGKSAEHEVSLQSAKNVLDALDTSKFTPTLIGIDKQGKWHVVDSQVLSNGAGLEQAAIAAESYTLVPGDPSELIASSSHARSPIDVAFPVLHGPHGEDGTIQGFFELAGIPYVGPSVLGSAVGMDKDVMKRLLRDAGLPIAPYVSFQAHERQLIDAEHVFEQLGTPVFVKPANLGSSVGVSRASSSHELHEAIDTAFDYDTKILIEQAIVGDEIECGVLGNAEPQASVIGRIAPKEGTFYSYEAKYIDADGALLEIPAALPEAVIAKAQDTALRTFKALACEGMGRVDMFLVNGSEIVVNEINTIPGFTRISMYPKLWEASGLSYTDLITRLIELAIERGDATSRLKSSTVA